VDDVPDECADYAESLPSAGNRELGTGNRDSVFVRVLLARLRATVPRSRLPVPALRHHIPSNTCCLNVATAPTTPADPSVPGRILHASTAGRNARRRTSARSGSKSGAPA